MMLNVRTAFASAVMILAAMTPAFGQQACPCVPITHNWAVKSCPDWNCAQTELLLAAGDPQVFAVPTSIEGTRWLVIRRSASGAAAIDPNEPFTLSQFDTMTAGVASYGAIAAELRPMLMTSPDGRVLVLSLKELPQPKRRSARR